MRERERNAVVAFHSGEEATFRVILLGNFLQSVDYYYVASGTNCCDLTRLRFGTVGHAPLPTTSLMTK